MLFLQYSPADHYITASPSGQWGNCNVINKVFHWQSWSQSQESPGEVTVTPSWPCSHDHVHTCGQSRVLYVPGLTLDCPWTPHRPAVTAWKQTVYLLDVRQVHWPLPPQCGQTKSLQAKCNNWVKIHNVDRVLDCSSGVSRAAVRSPGVTHHHHQTNFSDTWFPTPHSLFVF